MRLCAAAIGVLWLAGVAAAAEVRLEDGRTLVGEILSPPGAAVVDLRVASGRVSMVMHLPREDIVAIVAGPTPRQERLAELEAAADAARAAGDAEALWRIAGEVRALGETIRFRELAEAVLALERHHEAARDALGYRRHHGIWMLEHEIAVAEGLVFHDRRWMTWDEYRVAVAEERQEERERLARLEEREQARRERARAAAARQPEYAPIGLGLGTVSYRLDGSCGFPFLFGTLSHSFHHPFHHPTVGHHGAVRHGTHGSGVTIAPGATVVVPSR